MNVELKKEAEFFGDIVIVPYMDSYDLVVLKTVAICEYGVSPADSKNQIQHLMLCFQLFNIVKEFIYSLFCRLINLLLNTS